MTVVPYLPENRIGEALRLSEFKRPLAETGNGRQSPILVSFAAGRRVACRPWDGRKNYPKYGFRKLLAVRFVPGAHYVLGARNTNDPPSRHGNLLMGSCLILAFFASWRFVLLSIVPFTLHL